MRAKAQSDEISPFWEESSKSLFPYSTHVKRSCEHIERWWLPISQMESPQDKTYLASTFTLCFPASIMENTFLLFNYPSMVLYFGSPRRGRLDRKTVFFFFSPLIVWIAQGSKNQHYIDKNQSPVCPTLRIFIAWF